MPLTLATFLTVTPDTTGNIPVTIPGVSRHFRVNGPQTPLCYSP
jgi:hypothetical protein